ncbi:MAG: hypothetical protein WBQ55_06700, partial [Xanthobacteraceae bacterium]
MNAALAGLFHRRISKALCAPLAKKEARGDGGLFVSIFAVWCFSAGAAPATIRAGGAHKARRAIRTEAAAGCLVDRGRVLDLRVKACGALALRVGR